MKDRLVARLTQFYGEGAFSIIPRSYLLSGAVLAVAHVAGRPGPCIDLSE